MSEQNPKYDKNLHNMDQLFDFIDNVLENCVFDLTYHEKIKPLANEEQELYFQQSVERIQSARQMLNMIYIKSLKEQDRQLNEKPKGFLSKLKSLIWKKPHGNTSNKNPRF